MIYRKIQHIYHATIKKTSITARFRQKSRYGMKAAGKQQTIKCTIQNIAHCPCNNHRQSDNQPDVRPFAHHSRQKPSQQPHRKNTEQAQQ